MRRLLSIILAKYRGGEGVYGRAIDVYDEMGSEREASEEVALGMRHRLLSLCEPLHGEGR